MPLLQRERGGLHGAAEGVRPLNGYEGRIGRYGAELAQALIGVSGVRAGQRVLDVGCGTGALTVPLVERAGREAVSAVDPDADAIAACRERLPGVDVRVAPAEQLPYEDDRFDATLAQLVVGLLDDAPQAVREMRRVTRPGGVVATCVWDFGGGMTVLRSFWDAARTVEPEAARRHDQANTRPYSTRAELGELWRSAGLRDIGTGALDASAGYAGFDDLWGPLAVPDGAPGRFLETLGESERAAVREALDERLGRPRGAFRLEARAWYALGRA